MTKAYDLPKRVLDISVSGLALILTLPVQLALAIAIARKLGRPVLFRQGRPGLHGRTFVLMKFRTMSLPTHSDVTDEQRMTPFGAKLRSTSLDELPTLWNVLKGDMSLVGPRPLLSSYLDLYTEEQSRRHEVRPGVTGLAQVSGRNALDWDERLRLDVAYVDGRSLGMDVRILLRTVKTVFRRDGITEDGHVTVSEFRGSGHREL